MRIRDTIWGQIAKVVNDTIEVKGSELIERRYIDHIIKTILKSAFLKLFREEGINQNKLRGEINKDQNED